MNSQRANETDKKFERNNLRFNQWSSNNRQEMVLKVSEVMLRLCSSKIKPLEAVHVV